DDDRLPAVWGRRLADDEHTELRHGDGTVGLAHEGGGHAGRHRARRHVDEDAVAHGDAAEHLGPGAYHHMVADDRHRMLQMPVADFLPPDRHLVIDRHAGADHQVLVEHHTLPAVVEDEAAAD